MHIPFTPAEDSFSHHKSNNYLQISALDYFQAIYFIQKILDSIQFIIYQTLKWNQLQKIH
jgi:hypothetical protein